jgi:hypothetical protein
METNQPQEYMSGKRAAFNIAMIMFGTMGLLLLLKYLLGV